MSFIDTQKIESLLAEASAKLGTHEKDTVSAALKRAGQARGLSFEDTALLICVEDPALVRMILKKAGEVKHRVFGDRVVLFAPLYLSNYCTNGCKYCGFRSANSEVARKALSEQEVVRQAAALERMGFKRVLLVIGEDPRYGLDYIVASIRAIYKKTGIRIVHVNAPPMGIEELRELKAAGVGVYQAFQETYHQPTYEQMHPWGAKKDFVSRLGCMDRALAAGFNDVGIGSLLGLYDFRFDLLATVIHSNHLYSTFGTHAHTISVPRLRPASGSELGEVGWRVTDQQMKRIAAVYRLAVPTAGVVVSTREPKGLRTSLINTGASQLSAASRTNPGGYTNEKTQEQFSTSDSRNLEEVMASIATQGSLPSLCTACYRVGRVGEEFTRRAADGQMERLCQANALLSLAEYLLDHAKNGNTKLFEDTIKNAVNEIGETTTKKELLKKLKDLGEGERDLYL